MDSCSSQKAMEMPSPCIGLWKRTDAWLSEHMENWRDVVILRWMTWIAFFQALENIQYLKGKIVYFFELMRDKNGPQSGTSKIC